MGTLGLDPDLAAVLDLIHAALRPQRVQLNREGLDRLAAQQPAARLDGLLVPPVERATAIHVLHFWAPQYSAWKTIGQKLLDSATPWIQLYKSIKDGGGDAK